MSDELLNAVRDFTEKNVAQWEFKHGLLEDKARECMLAIVYGTMLADPRKLLEQVKSSEDGKGIKLPCCFCDFDGPGISPS